MQIEEVLRKLYEGESERSILVVCPDKVEITLFSKGDSQQEKYTDDEHNNVYQFLKYVDPRYHGGMRWDAVVFYSSPLDTFPMSRVIGYKKLPKNSVVMLSEHKGEYAAVAIDVREISLMDK